MIHGCESSEREYLEHGGCAYEDHFHQFCNESAESECTHCLNTNCEDQELKLLTGNIKRYGGDLFVINGCGGEEQKCNRTKELDKFCNESFTKVKVVGNCTHCTGFQCNDNKELELEKGSSKTTKCYGTFHPSNEYKVPKEFKRLFTKDKKRSTITSKGENCQTFTCQDGDNWANKKRT
ncbi:hypothetical protein niasHT_037015 [Heterodera trifolii]|uniref:Uncharacterized protein n=1 Tax=Heterodera trifolii TaxID=157864 RepID=A0ABD2IXS5_9BILA